MSSEWRDDDAAIPATSFAAQLVFVERVGSFVRLDGVTAVEAELEDGGAVACGTPFAVTAELPTTALWASLAAASVLDDWAESGVEITIAVYRGGRGLSVQLSDDATQLKLAMAA